MTIDDLTKGELVPMLRGRLQGRRVLRTQDGGTELVLDDGTILHLYMSESDCCANAHGEWVIQPDALDAMITDVRLTPDEERSGDDGDGTINYVTIAILHNQNPIVLAECSANNGSGGYYYSALSLRVSHVIDPSGRHDLDFKVVDA